MPKTNHWILAINVVIIFLYTLLSYDRHDEYYVFLVAFWIALHFVINLILALVLVILKKKELAKTCLLASVMVLVIGFATCLLSAQLQHF
jgi:hypothetical protein